MAAATVVVALVTSPLSSKAQETQFLDASPFALGPPFNAQPSIAQKPPPRGFAVGFTQSGGGLGAPSHVGQIPLNPRPHFDNPEFEGEEREVPSSKFPESEVALTPEDLTSAFDTQPDFDGFKFEEREESSVFPGDEGETAFGGETEDTHQTDGFPHTSSDHPDIPDTHTSSPSSPREEQHQSPPSSVAQAIHNPQVPDVTPQQEEELQVQPPSRDNAHHDTDNHNDQITKTFDLPQQFPETQEAREQLSTQSQFEESQDVVDVVSAPRPARSPIPARPRPYSEIPYRRTVHPNQLPSVSEI